MSKAPQKANKHVEGQSILATLPWACTKFGSQSEIEAYIEATGTWETIADVHTVAGFDATETAGFIVRAVNRFEKIHATLADTVPVLEICLEGKSLAPPMLDGAQMLLQRIRDMLERL